MACPFAPVLSVEFHFENKSSLARIFLLCRTGVKTLIFVEVCITNKGNIMLCVESIGFNQIATVAIKATEDLTNLGQYRGVPFIY